MLDCLSKRKIRQGMKRYILFALLLVFTIGISAQKNVRKSIRKGNSAFKEQRYTAAEENYAKALEENASSKEASFNLANTYYKQQRWDDALKEYQHYLTLENEDPNKMSTAWSNMGNTFLKKKANENSQQQAGGMMPQQGPQQQEQDNLKMSMEAYKNALRLNPQDDETRENLAIVQKMIKDQEGGGGENDDQEQNQEQQEQEQEQDNQDNKKDDKKDDQQENQDQMSQDNIQQILEAIEQEERETQERVNQMKADERKQKMDRNRRQDKDW